MLWVIVVAPVVSGLILGASNGLGFKSWWDTLRGEKLIQYRTGVDFHDMHVDTIFAGW